MIQNIKHTGIPINSDKFHQNRCERRGLLILITLLQLHEKSITLAKKLKNDSWESSLILEQCNRVKIL